VTRLRTFLLRLWALTRFRQMDRDIDDEIASHLAEAAEEYVRRGLSPEEARRAARRSFGGVTQAKEVYRQVRSFGWLEDLVRDLRFGARMLTKDRWITLAAVAALAIGIAANTTVFAIVHAILLRDLPFDQPDRIVAIGTHANNVRTLRAGVSYADFEDWRAAADTVAELGAMRETTMNVGDERSAPERFIGSYISANAFELVRQQPMLGRDFSLDDDGPGAVPVVILGHALWRNRYGSDPRVLGRTIRVNGVPSVVIGVMPDGFSFPTRSRLWQPLALLPERMLTSRDARDLSAFGRLAPGVTIEQSVAELNGIAGALAQQHPKTNRDVAPIVAPYRDRSVGGRGRSTLPVLMGVVAVVLLMACANVANLLLARAAVRSHEISVRMAIGAGRVQIVRQLLVESLVLAAVAGVAGWGLSLAAIGAISGTLDRLGGGGVGLPYWISFSMDVQVFAFSAGVCVATALLFGLVPALHTSKPGIASVLLEAGRATAGSVRSRRWAHGLVVFQLALAPVLLTAGGLMMRSIVAQYEMDAGVDTSRIMWARLNLPDAKYPAAADRVRFYQQLDERLAGIPGVVAGMVSHTPFGGGAPHNLWRDDEEVSQGPRRPRVLVVTTGPRYFEAFRMRVVRGSELPLLEDEDGTASVVLNEWLAAAVFPGENPIGRRVGLTPSNGPSPGPEWFTIAGVAPDIRQTSSEDASGRDGVVYVSYGINPMPAAGIVARSESDPSAVATALREQVRAVDPDLPLFELMRLDDFLDASDERVGLRVFGTMFVVFAFAALLLATVGLYAVTAYAAAQRTREIGLRMALGAQAAHVWWLVTRSAARQLGFGLSIGMAGAIGIGQLLGNVLVGTDVLDPLTLFAVAALLAVVGLCACVLPACRAMRLDPAAVLRSE
jgi:putative ABC transport system permease protein